MTWVLIATSWLILLLLWQVHVERRKNAGLRDSVRVYITGAAQQYQRALVAEGRLNSCMAQF